MTEDRPRFFYLAGPMSGYPQFNFPAFTAAAWALRSQGWSIVSPHEEDPPHIQALAMQSATGAPKDLQAGPLVWADRLAHDVKLVSHPACEGLVLLPGWEDSRGAILECTVGLLNDKHFYLWEGRTARPISQERAARRVAEYLIGGARA